MFLQLIQICAPVYTFNTFLPVAWSGFSSMLTFNFLFPLVLEINSLIDQIKLNLLILLTPTLNLRFFLLLAHFLLDSRVRRHFLIKFR